MQQQNRSRLIGRLGERADVSVGKHDPYCAGHAPAGSVTG
jgi:hypothetical protein